MLYAKYLKCSNSNDRLDRLAMCNDTDDSFEESLEENAVSGLANLKRNEPDSKDVTESEQPSALKKARG